jgi:hypothetical protein
MKLMANGPPSSGAFSARGVADRRCLEVVAEQSGSASLGGIALRDLADVERISSDPHLRRTWYGAVHQERFNNA